VFFAWAVRLFFCVRGGVAVCFMLACSVTAVHEFGFVFAFGPVIRSKKDLRNTYESRQLGTSKIRMQYLLRSSAYIS
jgi:hypothetical protein